MEYESLKAVSRTDDAKFKIQNFIRARGSGFVFLRGRRRIGKSTLLKEFSEQKNIFYFTGVLDERESKTHQRFVQNWREFYSESKLDELKKSVLSWQKIFSDILERGKIGITTVIFDEVQWLAKGQSGFVGLLKEAWLAWEKTGRIKIIICGSSNKFFHTQSGGEEQILRGLRTHADIWLSPIGLENIRHDLKLNWSNEEMLFASFFLSGIPYYWNQVQNNNSTFLKALNAATLTSHAIFLDEINELLRIEFNSSGVETVKKIIRAIGVTGANESLIVQKTRLSQSSVNETLKKLLDYSIIFEKKRSYLSSKEIKVGVSYYLKDPLLYSYAAIFYPNRVRILKSSTEEFLLGRLLSGKRSLYIPEFSGPSFENTIQMMIEVFDFKSNIQHLLEIGYSSNTVDRFSDPSVQIDLIVKEVDDRVIRAIECKWTHDNGLISNQLSTINDRLDLFKKKNNLAENVQPIIITNCSLSASLKRKAQQEKVRLISVDELFG